MVLYVLHFTELKLNKKVSILLNLITEDRHHLFDSYSYTWQNVSSKETGKRKAQIKRKENTVTRKKRNKTKNQEKKAQQTDNKQCVSHFRMTIKLLIDAYISRFLLIFRKNSTTRNSWNWNNIMTRNRKFG